MTVDNSLSLFEFVKKDVTLTVYKKEVMGVILFIDKKSLQRRSHLNIHYPKEC